MTAAKDRLYLKSALCLLLPALFMNAFVIGEQNYNFYEYGLFLLVGLLLAFSVIACAANMFAIVRSTGLGFSISYAVILASSPLWGFLRGVEPNMHGLSLPLWFLFAIIIWLLSACLAIASLWKRFFVRQNPGENIS